MLPKKKPRTNNIKKPLNEIQHRKSVVGQVYVCGTGDCAQLGLTDDVTDVVEPTLLNSLPNSIVDISCGGLHTLALTEDGKLYSWGSNDDEALGRDGDEYVPGLVEFSQTVDIVQIAAGDSLSAVLTSKGDVYAWGTFRNKSGVLGFYKSPGHKQATPTLIYDKRIKGTFASITTSYNNLFILTANGRVYSLGDDDCSQLGVRKLLYRGSKQKVIQGLHLNCVSLKNVVSVHAGGYNVFAVDNDGTVFSWGLNNFYQCAQPASLDGKQNIPFPKLSVALTDLGVKDIVGGQHHTLVLSKEGNLFGVGRADSAQLGCGEFNELVILYDGGNSASMELIPIALPNAISHISAGTFNGFAVASELYAWGYGDNHALGTGEEEDVVSPRLVTAFKDKEVLMVAAGAHHTVFLVKSR